MKTELKTYEHELKTGITKSPEFRKKKLATHAANCGLKCGHGCTYCSTPSLNRQHQAYREVGKTAFEPGYCILDPTAPLRIAQDAPKLCSDDVVMVNTLTDSWSPEARKYDIGSQMLNILLEKSSCNVRVLTKGDEVNKDFGLMKKFGDRLYFSMSLTAPAEKEGIIKVIEPNAASITKRIEMLQEAHNKGIKTYGMLCPCLPGIADDKESLTSMFNAVLDAGATEIWTEPVNARGNNLVLTETALRNARYENEANAVNKIRKRKNWIDYALAFINTIDNVISEVKNKIPVHVLMYSSNFKQIPRIAVKNSRLDIIWL
ncbi:MAG: hypothetical protein A3J83_00410 [Elusimicrobia bacterium RIFOXYA2_FULL_40_6]|nr:MAG: hypothetical protein A3J83_00410 [Elusimicrobia bacterium RIFOXYA2_FULL_40_6]